MGILAEAIIVPLAFLFFMSGLVVNLFQAVFFVLVRPLSKNTYRRINRVLAELLWLELIWIVDWWANVKVLKLVFLYHSFTNALAGLAPNDIVQRSVGRLDSRHSESVHVQVYTDPETFQMMGKEHALVICNHRSDIDWLVGWVLAQRSGCLGSTLAVMKKSFKLQPVIGWSMWFSEYLFLERNWAKDESTLKSGLQQVRDYPLPFWLALFVEGTRFTQAKLLAAQEYAVSAGLPVPRNVLIPRTKGFVSAVSHMRSFVPAIYDVTVAIPKSSPPPTMLRLFMGKSSVVHVHLKRHLMKDLPETDESVAQWCKDVFVEKDKLLDKHNDQDSFGEDLLRDTRRPVKSLVVVVSWACLIGLGALKFFQWSSIFSSWKGLVALTFVLGIVTVAMHILIKSSQSEHSTPAKVSPGKVKKAENSAECVQKQE